MFYESNNIYKNLIIVIKKNNRSLHEKNKIILASFCEHDMKKIVESKDKKIGKINKMHGDIGDFLKNVCDDIKQLYPSSINDNDFIVRIFKRFLETNT